MLEIDKLKKLAELDANIAKLNHDNVLLVYFKYKKSGSNLIKKPFLAAMWLFYKIARKKGLDHIAFASNFIKNDVIIEMKIFESTMYGVFESDLKEKLKHFNGDVIIEDTYFKVDKDKARKFMLDHIGQGYSVIDAAKSGVDGWLGKKLNKIFKKKGVFCSELAANFCKDQGMPPFIYKSQGDLAEMTPDDIWNLNLGIKSILYRG